MRRKKEVINENYLENIPEIKKFSLTAVAKQAGIVLEGFHRGNEYVGIYQKIFSKLVEENKSQ